MRFLSDVKTEVPLIKRRSLDQFDFRAKGITQELLRYKGVLTNADIAKVPYVVKHRNTDLEKLQILGQGYVIFKTIADEIFKIIGLVADVLTPLGAAPAIVNIALTFANLIILFQRLIDWIKLAIDTFFPPVKYHGGIKPKTFIDKAAEYIGLDSVDYGTLTDIMNELTWLGSKNHEEGIPTFFGNLPGLLDGIMNPGDQGYLLAYAVDVLTEQFNLDRAIIDNVLHLRPKNDPFWLQQSGYTMPDVLVEQTFANNGTWRPNYEDLKSATIIEYATDDSDLWTLDSLLDEQNPATTGRIISSKRRQQPINRIKRS